MKRKDEAAFENRNSRMIRHLFKYAKHTTINFKVVFKYGTNKRFC